MNDEIKNEIKGWSLSIIYFGIIWVLLWIQIWSYIIGGNK